ncbi:MAG TPA: hypothetical protein VE961_17285 [Pyrinomonadaceae bacterium]|nr:hypothetical protein [Pyrinomonadaceae bacterium]
MNKRGQKIVIVVGVVGVCGLFALGSLVGAAVVGYRAVMRAGAEAATVQNLKTIAAVEAHYFIGHDRTYATFDQLLSEKGLSSKFGGHPVRADDYVFNLTVSPKADGSSWYKLTADPVSESGGGRHFYFDSDDGQVRVNADRQAGPTDPVNPD